MKFGQVIEYNRMNIFLSNNHAEKKAERVAPDFLFFKKALHEIKERGLQLSFKSIKAC